MPKAAKTPKPKLRLWLETIEGGDPKTVDLKILGDASKATIDYINEHYLGGGTFVDGLIYQEPFRDEDIVAITSYNGRIWLRGEKSADEYLDQCLARNRAEGTCTLPPWVTRVWTESTAKEALALAFLRRFAGDPVAEVLVDLDGSLEKIAVAGAVEPARQRIREAMARKLGFSGYRKA